MRLLFALSTATMGLLSSCNSSHNQLSLVQLQGKTMGTTYHISYLDSLQRNFQTSADSILFAFNKELSTYDSTSLLSQFNRDSFIVLTNNGKHLLRNIDIAKKVYQTTNQWFDPTVKPLVNYWGFGYNEKRPIEQIDSAVVDSLRSLLGMHKIMIENNGNQIIIRKTDRRTQLDVNAFAPGDAADLIGAYLEGKGIRNYMVEIGGEVFARGNSNLGKPWRIGINVPHENAATSDFQEIISLENAGMATSGNYRSFYEKNGKRYTHTINPKTGYTENNRLLSATIIAPTAALADAYATACMAMGIDSAAVWAEKQPDIKAYFIYTDPDAKELKEKYIRLQTEMKE